MHPRTLEILNHRSEQVTLEQSGEEFIVRIIPAPPEIARIPIPFVRVDYFQFGS